MSERAWFNLLEPQTTLHQEHPFDQQDNASCEVQPLAFKASIIDRMRKLRRPRIDRFL